MRWRSTTSPAWPVRLLQCKCRRTFTLPTNHLCHRRVSRKRNRAVGPKRSIKRSMAGKGYISAALAGPLRANALPALAFGTHRSGPPTAALSEGGVKPAARTCDFFEALPAATTASENWVEAGPAGCDSRQVFAAPGQSPPHELAIAGVGGVACCRWLCRLRLLGPTVHLTPSIEPEMCEGLRCDQRQNGATAAPRTAMGSAHANPELSLLTGRIRASGVDETPHPPPLCTKALLKKSLPAVAGQKVALQGQTAQVRS